MLLSGFEPEEESPIVFLRLRKASRKHGLKVFSVAPFATRGLHKLGGTLLRAAPGAEAEADRARSPTTASVALDAGGVILVGERLAAVPGALSAALRLAAATGARLAWVPRRAGERGAIEAGCLPNLLPIGRPVADAGGPGRRRRAWDVDALPDRRPAGTPRASSRPPRPASSTRWWSPASTPTTCPTRPRPRTRSRGRRSSSAWSRGPARSPTAPTWCCRSRPVAEKSGTFVDWEGRGAPVRGRAPDSPAC